MLSASAQAFQRAWSNFFFLGGHFALHEQPCEEDDSVGSLFNAFYFSSMYNKKRTCT